MVDSALKMTIDQRFHVPRTPLAVVAVGDGMEALLIRAILESLGAAVTLHLAGTPQDFLEVLAQGESAPRYIVVSGHGDRGGFLFGDYDRRIDTTMLVEGSLPADAIASRVRLPGKVVISTACETGAEAFGAAFIRGKVAAYVAPSGSPEGAIVPLFLHCLFHQLLQRKAPLDAALRRAQAIDGEARMFVRYGAAEKGR